MTSSGTNPSSRAWLRDRVQVIPGGAEVGLAHARSPHRGPGQEQPEEGLAARVENSGVGGQEGVGCRHRGGVGCPCHLRQPQTSDEDVGEVSHRHDVAGVERELGAEVHAQQRGREGDRFLHASAISHHVDDIGHCRIIRLHREGALVEPRRHTLHLGGGQHQCPRATARPGLAAAVRRGRSLAGLRGEIAVRAAIHHHHALQQGHRVRRTATSIGCRHPRCRDGGPGSGQAVGRRGWPRAAVGTRSASLEGTGWPVSRVLSPVAKGATIHLGLPLPTASSDLPAHSGEPPSRSKPSCAVWSCSGWGLPSCTGRPVHWWALAPPFHPYLQRTGGGLFSVALSRGSPRVGVTHHPALWSPDFPRDPTPRGGGSRGRPASPSADHSREQPSPTDS